MTDEIKITEDGRLLCPNCSNDALQALQNDEVELRHVVLHHRKDISKVRFDQKDDMLVIIGDPVDGDTLEVYDEFLHCPQCQSRHNIPWAEDGDQQQDQVEYEGDFQRMLKPDLKPNICPCCGSDNTELYDDYMYSYQLTVDEDGTVVASNDGECEWEGGATNHRMGCCDCNATFSIHPDIEYD